MLSWIHEAGRALICLFVLGLRANVDPAFADRFRRSQKCLDWLQGVLLDADSAKIECRRAQAADLGKMGAHLRVAGGFSGELAQSLCQYPGKQSHGALIRDDRVIRGIGFGYETICPVSDL